MRSVVKDLWENVIKPDNDERILDAITFFTFVFNGEITHDEVQEILKGQIQ
jgi:hypothetical protein